MTGCLDLAAVLPEGAAGLNTYSDMYQSLSFIVDREVLETIWFETPVYFKTGCTEPRASQSIWGLAFKSYHV